MTDKVLAYALYADQKAKEIASSQRKWTDFLHTASRMYKYNYYDQLLIHAQRPDATACASYEIWNQRMNRYIRRGSKGIGLLDTDGDELRLRYVFDVSDTGVRPNSLPVEQWRLTEENETAVAWMLSREYGIPDNIPVADQIEMISTMLTRDYWIDHRQEIGDLDKVDGTIIAAYDRDTIGAAFRRAAAVSTAYTLMLRCGEPVEKYFSPEDFKDVFDFNTPEAIATIGSAVSICCGQVLRQIEKTIRSTERSKEDHDRTDLHPARGLPELKILSPTHSRLHRLDKILKEPDKMLKLISCKFNFDTACVELRFTENVSLSIDCDVVEQQYAHTVQQRCDLDYLVYNAPLEYAQLVLSGKVDEYLRIK